LALVTGCATELSPDGVNVRHMKGLMRISVHPSKVKETNISAASRKKIYMCPQYKSINGRAAPTTLTASRNKVFAYAFTVFA
jgi:hypothetical protein